MTLINGYCTLDEFKAHRGGDFGADTNDDTVIEAMIEAASRYHEGETGRVFYPRVETQYFNQSAARGIRTNDDLLAVITLTNGDGNTIASTEYNLYPLNTYPKNELRLKETSTEYWDTDSDSNTEGVIDLAAFWGFHNDYARRAWKSASTVNEVGGLNATDVVFSINGATKLSIGSIIKIDNELMIVTAISVDDITVNQRGDNGSTAATHADDAPIYAWVFMPDIRQSVLELANAMYGRRAGDNAAGESIITTAGAVVTTRNIPAYTAAVIRKYRRYV